MFELQLAFLNIFGEFFGDAALVLKILVFLAIINFARNHLGNSPLTLVVVGIFTYFIIFQFWWIFGTMYILYVLLTLGIGAFFVDFFFVSQMAGGGQGAAGGEETGHHAHGGHGPHHMSIPGAPPPMPPMPPPMRPG